MRVESKHGIREILDFVDTKSTEDETAESFVREVLTVIWGWAQLEQLRLSNDDRSRMVSHLRRSFTAKGIEINEAVQRDRHIEEAWRAVAV
ncbi:MAG: hypothetical protein ABI758_03030 [Candidatus Woesebacteria bacterium]